MQPEVVYSYRYSKSLGPPVVSAAINQAFTKPGGVREMYRVTVPDSRSAVRGDSGRGGSHEGTLRGQKVAGGTDGSNNEDVVSDGIYTLAPGLPSHRVNGVALASGDI